MAENKKGFLLYCDLIHTIGRMPDEKAGELFKHILMYVNDQNPVARDLIIELTFEPIKQQLKRDLAKWEETSFKKSENGKKGGEASAIARKLKQEQANEANASTVKQNQHDTVNDTVTDNDILKEQKLISEFRIEDCKLKKDSIGFQVMDISAKLFTGFKKNFPHNKDLDRIELIEWVPHVRTLVQEKKYTYDQIREVLNWAMEDKFWKTTIINAKILEKNFEQIKLKYQDV